MSSFSSLCVRAGMPPILKKKTETKTWQHLESSCSSNKRSNVPLHFLRVFVKEAPAVFTFVCVCCCKYAEQCLYFCSYGYARARLCVRAFCGRLCNVCEGKSGHQETNRGGVRVHVCVHVCASPAQAE